MPETMLQGAGLLSTSANTSTVLPQPCRHTANRNKAKLCSPSPIQSHAGLLHYQDIRPKLDIEQQECYRQQWQQWQHGPLYMQAWRLDGSPSPLLGSRPRVQAPSSRQSSSAPDCTKGALPLASLMAACTNKASTGLPAYKTCLWYPCWSPAQPASASRRPPD